MTPNSRRAVTMNGTLSLSVSLSSYGEQDRREGATITTPWDSIVHAGGGGYSGGGENGIAAVGGAATADAGEEGGSTATGSPYWIASAGSFPEGNVGESVTWKAPDTPANGVIIQVVVDDLGQKPENEAGSADDTAVEAGRMLVDVVKTSIVRTASWIKVNDDDDDGNGTADMDDDEAVENEDDLRAAFTLDLSPSGLSDGTLVLSDKSDTPRIRVWMTSHEGTKQPLTLPKEWSMSEFGSLPDKTLYVEGLQPSLETDDVTLELKYAGNGCTTAATASLTVVHLDLDADANYDGQRDIADEHPEDNPGLIVLLNDDDDNDNKTMDKDDADAVEDEDDLQKITLAFAPAALPNATLKLEASAGSDSIKIWAAEDKSGEPLTLPKIYRPAAAPAPEGDDPAPPLPSTLYVEGFTAGDATLKLSFVNDDAIFDEITLHVVKIGLLPDFNRDRKIDDEDQTLLITKGPFRFWLNDDEDSGSDGGNDIPGGGSANAGNGSVDGVRDLVDFFPVWVDIKNALSLLPMDKYDYVLKHAGGALNAFACNSLPTSDTPDLKPSAYLFSTNFGSTYGTCSVGWVKASGLTLPEGFLNEILNNDRGIVLLEGRSATTIPLVLEVRHKSDGATICEKEMPLSLSGVENMYRHINLRPSDGLPTSTGEPSNYPDSMCNNINVFFMHGFSVGGDGARGWHAEMFKRLHWSGSNAMFWGITWQGDLGLFDALHYQEDVANAFLVASDLYAEINSVPNKIMLAHSLGNMVVSAAIQDHGLSVSKYFMLDAAVASECYDSSSFNTSPTDNKMLNSAWSGYNANTWCATWFDLFTSPDDRAKLTWQDRFPAVLSVAYNFYSSGDEIFETHENPGPFSGGLFHLERYAWQKQELFKGRGGLGGTSWAGWGFSGEYTTAEANAASDTQLRANPVFVHAPTTMLSSNITAQVRNNIIAQGVPALSSAAGVGNITGSGSRRNYDMSIIRPNGWGRSGGIYDTRWLHSDLKNMAYLYTYKPFDEIVTQGDLQ